MNQTANLDGEKSKSIITHVMGWQKKDSEKKGRHTEGFGVFNGRTMGGRRSKGVTATGRTSSLSKGTALCNHCQNPITPFWKELVGFSILVSTLEGFPLCMQWHGLDLFATKATPLINLLLICSYSKVPYCGQRMPPPNVIYEILSHRFLASTE